MTIKKILLLSLVCFGFFRLYADRRGAQSRASLVGRQVASPHLLDNFKKTIHDFQVTSHEQLRSAQWFLHGNPFEEPIIENFIPFAQKLIIAPGSQIAFFGDLHGNKKALDCCLRQLQSSGYLDHNLTIIKPDFYCVFLGDYVDRGPAGVEVLKTVLTLKIRNPESVILVRGNHEDKLLNAVYGFKSELLAKFPTITEDEMNAVYTIYEYMPSVLYLGSGEGNFIQCCHGGMEIGYNPNRLLNDTRPDLYQVLPLIERVEAVRELPTTLKQALIKNIPEHEIRNFKPIAPTNPLTIGFLWNDFIENSAHYHSSVVDYASGRGWVFGEKLTAHVLAKMSSPKAKVRAIFRAHQHHGGMLALLEQNKGFVRLWDGMVHTFLTAPFPNLKFSSVSFGILHTAHHYQDWRLEHVII